MVKNSLSSFIKNSVAEMFSGIILGELENEKVLIELKENVNISNEKFVKKFFTTSDIRAEILELFPSEEINISSVDEGKEYIVTDIGIAEEPAIYDLTSYIMKENIDYIKENRKFFITEKGYENILKVVSENMAIARKFQLREFIKKGLPKLVVSSGRLNAKVLLEDSDYDDNKVHGLTYKLYKSSELKNELIGSGISNNLEINDKRLAETDVVIYDGYIIINNKNCYEFWVKSNNEVTLSINNEIYLQDTGRKILLKEGIHPIKIVTKNIDNRDYFIDIYMKANYIGKIKLDDEFFLTDIDILEINNENNSSISVRVIDINKNKRDDLSSFISEIELSYKINTDNSI